MDMRVTTGLIPMRAIPAFVLALSALSVPAQATTPPLVMMCQLRDESGTGWVPEFIMLTRQVDGPHKDRLEVFDPILKGLTGRPIKAVVVADDGRTRSYGWALAGVRNANGQRTKRLDYRLSVDRRTGKAALSATAQGYDNVMTGSGACGSPPGR